MEALFKEIAGHRPATIIRRENAPIYREFLAGASYKGRWFLDPNGTLWTCIRNCLNMAPNKDFMWVNMVTGQNSALLVLSLRPVNLSIDVQEEL